MPFRLARLRRPCRSPALSSEALLDCVEHCGAVRIRQFRIVHHVADKGLGDYRLRLLAVQADAQHHFEQRQAAARRVPVVFPVADRALGRADGIR